MGSRRGVALAALATLVAVASLIAPATAWTAERVGSGPGTATIARDRYGVPHVQGRTVSGMWFGAGWAQAEDRLAQMELVRRNVRGTLSELFGTLTLSDDQDNRRDFYTGPELAAEYRGLPRSIRRALRDYADGVNAFVAHAYATPARRDRLVPFEFWTIGKLLGLAPAPYRPAPWSVLDTVAVGNYLAREFGGGGGSELDYEAFSRYLRAERAKAGDADPGGAARQIFDDALWIDDPTAPTTVPSTARAATAASAGGAPAADPAIARLPDASILGAARALADSRAARERIGRTLHVPWKDGSNAYVIAPWRSASGRALLWGGPQEGHDSPNIDVEAYLRAPGYAAGGMAIPGEPFILIGQNRDIAFTTTSEELVDQQTYVEQGVDFGTDPPTYLFRGRRIPMRKVVEPLAIHGQPTQRYVIYRTVHGPVFKTDPANHVAYSMRFASWGREGGTLAGFAGQGGARTLAQYRSAISRITTLHNFFYADRRGNIAYFGAGLVPILPRCAACDPRLPHNGDGSQEWRGYVPFARMPHSVNPRQGYLVNWNTKPVAGPRELAYQQNGGDEYWGTIYRSDRIAELIRSKRKVRYSDLARFSRDFGTMDGDETYRPAAGRFLPFLLAAYERLARAGDPLVAPATHPQLAGAIALLRRWDRNTSIGSPAMSIFVQWMAELQLNTFGGGDHPGEAYVGPVNLRDTSLGGDTYMRKATYNLEYHMLAGTRGLDPCDRRCWSGDYFGGQRDRILVESLVDGMARLSGTGPLLANGDAKGFGTADPASWGWSPWPDIDWDNLNTVAQVGGAKTHFGRSPSQERSTYMQAMELSTPIRGTNVLPPGQSGFLSKAGLPSPHFGDQIRLFDRIVYKPMRLGG